MTGFGGLWMFFCFVCVCVLSCLFCTLCDNDKRGKYWCVLSEVDVVFGPSQHRIIRSCLSHRFLLCFFFCSYFMRYQHNSWAAKKQCGTVGTTSIDWAAVIQYTDYRSGEREREYVLSVGSDERPYDNSINTRSDILRYTHTIISRTPLC